MTAIRTPHSPIPRPAQTRLATRIAQVGRSSSTVARTFASNWHDKVCLLLHSQAGRLGCSREGRNT
jgi:hypothetical protein